MLFVTCLGMVVLDTEYKLILCADDIMIIPHNYAMWLWKIVEFIYQYSMVYTLVIPLMGTSIICCLWDLLLHLETLGFIVCTCLDLYISQNASKYIELLKQP